MSLYESPEESLPRACELCNAFAEIGRLCPMDAMLAAVENDARAEAYAIAEDFGYPASTVRRMLRDKMERELTQAVRELRLSVVSMNRTLAARKAA